MRLVIAEKPSVAKAIAETFNNAKRGDGYIDCGETKITWCFGHMYELAEPDEYTAADVPTLPSGKKKWREEDLPIIPDTWRLSPRPDAKKQLGVIRRLIRESSSIVHAGDPDREGQLLVDEILIELNYTKPVQRFIASSIDSATVTKALANLEDNQRYRGWTQAAIGRQRADWLIGMNLSRAFTLSARRGGSLSLVTVGRVQTPTLALVVARDREIAAFKPQPYQTLHADIDISDQRVTAHWQPSEAQEGLDSEGRLTSPQVGATILAALKGAAATVATCEQKQREKAAPIGFSLAGIGAAASSAFGYTADQVLKICQSLYETHKVTSYPRTDSGYLPESQHSDAPAILASLKDTWPDFSGPLAKVNPAQKSRIWNDAKVTAHHAIVPTRQRANLEALTPQERNIYELICRNYIAQFLPPYKYTTTEITFDVVGETFKAKGQVELSPGWRQVYRPVDEKPKEEDQPLPLLKKADAGTVAAAYAKDKKTKPPARFTDGSLVLAMENIYKFVEKPEHKKLLRDGDGIGTSATRGSILEDLVRRGFLERKAKHVLSTELGRSVIDALPPITTSPILTALYERQLGQIESDPSMLPTFINKQIELVRNQVEAAGGNTVSLKGGKQLAAPSSQHKCMSCNSGLIRRKGRKSGYWWGCSGYPDCKQTYPDVKGRPNYRSSQPKEQTK